MDPNPLGWLQRGRWGTDAPARSSFSGRWGPGRGAPFEGCSLGLWLAGVWGWPGLALWLVVCPPVDALASFVPRVWFAA